jgi:hypothetical protein
MNPITCDQFKKRLVDLCVRSGQAGLSRRPQDRHILLKSVVLTLDRAGEYAEPEINEALKRWLAHIGRSLDLDHAALRRYLVDDGYLERDRDGSRYRVSAPERHQTLFEPAVEEIDVFEVVRAGRESLEQKKQAYLRRQNSDP